MEAVLRSSEMSGNTSTSRGGNQKEGVNDYRESLRTCYQGIKHAECEAVDVTLHCGGVPLSCWGLLLIAELMSSPSFIHSFIHSFRILS